ncbi:N-acetylmuramoyl-L-alanine amidase [Streptomyces sp. NPDC051320]|uniref:N-acetylmuramoyl-L-alanine amidase n=1 Tax=Streptomyces sp. NPDC051320 TaxID=3154644 RepID=UPI00341E4AC9
MTAVAALVAICLAGWFVRSATAGSDDTAASGKPGVHAGGTPQTPAPPHSTGHDDTGRHDSGQDEKPAATGPLAGKVVVIDPGHNPTNYRYPREINRKVNIGTNSKECDTTGTSTNAGYAEARFTLDVSHRLRALLEKEGATVKLTQDNNRPYGPCVTERAAIGNEARADAAISVHADGSAAGNRGFHVILPARVKSGAADTTKIVAPSRDLGTRIAGTFLRDTGSAPSNYIGGGTGLDTRGDLGGLNLSTVPKVFIECGNMRDPEDAAQLTSDNWRQKAAQGIADGITGFLHG